MRGNPVFTISRSHPIVSSAAGCVIPSDAKANECLGLPQPVRPRMLFHYTHPRAEIIAEKL
jgi:hypothetical protein